MTDRETIDVYNARAADYADIEWGEAAAATLDAFIARLPKGAAVLDMGCGPGQSSAHMAKAGLNPDPVDPAEAMIEIAKTRFNLPARIGTFQDLSGPYHGIWANFSLLHMPRADVPAYFRTLHEAMHPGGILHLGLKTGEGEARDRIGRQYSYFTPEETAAWLTDAGFTPEPPLTGHDKGLAGTIDPWFTLSAIRD